MLKDLFTKPLRLELDDRVITFNSPGDFEFSLASRTEVPAGKVAALVRLDADALRREARSIRDVERRFVEVIAKSIEESGNIGYLIREMDAKLFSQDHGWRQIISALASQPKEFDEFKKIALVKYVQYLASRQDVLKSLYAAGPRAWGGASEPDLEPEPAANPALRQTLIFDVAQPPPEPEQPPTPGRLERLPRGETISVAVAPGEEIRLVLSRHRFTLVTGERTYLADENGGDYLLHPGRNLVGRQPGMDVVVDSAYRDVSRKHLVIEVDSERRLLLTDLSSHGTFVPSAAVFPDPTE